MDDTTTTEPTIDKTGEEQPTTTEEAAVAETSPETMDPSATEDASSSVPPATDSSDVPQSEDAPATDGDASQTAPESGVAGEDTQSTAEPASQSDEAPAEAPATDDPSTQQDQPPVDTLEETSPSEGGGDLSDSQPEPSANATTDQLTAEGESTGSPEGVSDDLLQSKLDMQVDLLTNGSQGQPQDDQDAESAFQRQVQSPAPEDPDAFKFVHADFEKDPQLDPLLPSSAQPGGDTTSEPALLQPESVELREAAAPPVEDPAVEALDREQLVADLRAALEEREKLKAVHLGLQARLSEHLKRKKLEESSQDEAERQAVDHGQRYTAALVGWQDLQKELAKVSLEQQAYISDMALKLEEKKKEVDLKMAEFVKYRRQVSLTAANSKTGKPIPPKVLDQMEQMDQRKNAEVVEVMLENIKLRNKVKRCDTLLRQKEELADGLHLIDFEQLKIENQTFNEKIEDRNEEVLKLKKKLVMVVQMLSHLKEKLSFVQKESFHLRDNLSQLDVEVGTLRDDLPDLKRIRDQERKQHIKLQHENGLRGNRMLLLDYEKKVDATEELQKKIEELRKHHATLMAESASLKKKYAVVNMGE